MKGRGITVRYRRSKTQRFALKQKLVDMLGGKCVDCGYSAHLAALDFDHREPKFKYKSIASMICGQYTDNEIIMEMHKCDLRCANCHRVKTHPDYTEENRSSSKENDNGSQ